MHSWRKRERKRMSKEMKQRLTLAQGKSYIFLHVNAQYFVFVCVSFVYECIALCMFACIPVFCVTIWLSLDHPCECAVWQYVYECVWWVWGCLGNHCGQQSGILCEICVFVRIYSWIWLFRVPLSFSLWVCTAVCACVFFSLSGLFLTSHHIKNHSFTPSRSQVMIPNKDK